MPCNAVAYGWAQVSEPALLRMLDLKTVDAVLSRFLEAKSKTAIDGRHQVGADDIILYAGDVRVRYTGGKIEFTFIRKSTPAEREEYVRGSEHALRQIAIKKLKLQVAKAVQARGGTVLAAEENPKGTLLKVEVAP